MWKWIITFLKCREKPYARFVTVKGIAYTVFIEKYIPVDERLKKWQEQVESYAPNGEHSGCDVKK